MKKILVGLLMMAFSCFTFAHDAHTTESLFANVIHLLTAPDHIVLMLAAAAVIAVVFVKKSRLSLKRSKVEPK